MEGQPLDRTRINRLRDGEVRVSETEPDAFLVTWHPYRRDHPDYPGTSLTSDSDSSIPTDSGLEGVMEWAEARFAARDTRHLIEVLIDEGAPPEEVQQLEGIFDEAGLPAIVSGSIGRRSGDLLPWTMMVEVPLAAFVTALAGAAGADAWKTVKAFVTRVYSARRRPNRPDGTIVVHDREGTTIILSEDLPDRAYRELAEKGVPPRGYYIWDRAQGGWRDHDPPR